MPARRPRQPPQGQGFLGPGGMADVLQQRAAALPQPGAMQGFLGSQPGPEEIEAAMGPVMGILGPLVGPMAGVKAFKGMNAYAGGPTYRSSAKGMVKIADDPYVEIRKFDRPGKPYAGFFSDDPAVASRFAEGFGEQMKGAVYPVKLNFKNPAVIDAKGRHAAAYQFDQVGREQGVKKASGLIDRLFEKNPKIDGVILRNTADEGTVYIPRNPSQVESAIRKGPLD